VSVFFVGAWSGTIYGYRPTAINESVLGVHVMKVAGTKPNIIIRKAFHGEYTENDAILLAARCAFVHAQWYGNTDSTVRQRATVQLISVYPETACFKDWR